MSDRPLLFFPVPESVSRSRQWGGGDNVHRPSPGRQGKRLAPKFDQLHKSFKPEHATLQGEAGGIDPEQVLVFETVGSIENFAGAVKKIEGFEWLGEIEVEEIIPDDDFYDNENRDKSLSGRLYLIMSNSRAFEELLSLWKRHQEDHEMAWERGYAKYRDLFLCLKDVRRWDVQERLHDTGVEEYWEEELQHSGNAPIPFELELWYRTDKNKRQRSIAAVEELIREEGGHVRATAIIPEIQYIGMMADLPRKTIRRIIKHPAVKLVSSNDIMFFRPAGQMAVGRYPVSGDVQPMEVPEEIPTPNNDPVIAVFDGFPLARHRLLADRVHIDDPDNWGEDYPPNCRIHGTAMASLVIHGDLNEPPQPLARPIYVRPIFKPARWESGEIQQSGHEAVPLDCLPVDLIHRAVRRLFEGEQDTPPAAPHVKIINLSYGDHARPFFQFTSPMARLLDYLSHKYDVLFVVSAGNCLDEIIFDIPENELRNMSPADREAMTVKILYEEIRNRRLLSPAESINALTVGAVHYDTSTVENLGRRLDLMEQQLPSPISAFGSGYRRSVKPDMVLDGGKQLYDAHPRSKQGKTTMECRTSTLPPGIKAAHPGKKQGDLNATAYSCGTSNATALVSHLAGQCYDSLLDVISSSDANVTPAQETALLKAMLVHGCSWGDVAERIDNILRHPDHIHERRDFFKKHISRWLGYGVPSVSRVLGCTGQRVTLLGYGELQEEQAAVFRLPLPPSLSGCRVQRRLTATLAWLSPVISSSQKYRSTQLWFECNNSIASTRQENDWQMVRRGTVQHEIFTDTSAVPYPVDDALEIKVNCKRDAGKISVPIVYGLAVSLEVAESTNIPIYDEVQQRIKQAVQVRSQR